MPDCASMLPRPISAPMLDSVKFQVKYKYQSLIYKLLLYLCGGLRQRLPSRVSKHRVILENLKQAIIDVILEMLNENLTFDKTIHP